jgi:FkbM family methyltransferase
MQESLFKNEIRSLFFRPGTVRTIRFDPLKGIVYRVSSSTGMSAWYSEGQWEHQRVFKRILRHGDVAFDVGANWGEHTLLFSKLVAKSGVVHCFECLPDAQQELSWHIEHNRLANVRAHSTAVADYNGVASFLVGDSTSTGSLAEDGQQGKTIEVNTLRLDSLVELPEIERLRLVKIDVEGAEIRVLRGAEHITDLFRPYYVVDLHTPEQDIAVAKWLTERSYRLERVGGPPIERVDQGWPHSEGVWGSILATPY